LYPPEASAPQQSHSFPASITLASPAEPTPRFVSPVWPERFWPLLATWDWAGIAAFAIAFSAAQARERRRESFALTLGEWLPTLGLSLELWEGMLLPWAASISSGDIEQTRGESARATMVFAAKALPPNPLDPVLYYVLNQGMVEAMRRMLAECSTVQLLTRATVHHVSRTPQGGFTIRCVDGGRFTVDDLVFASSGPGTLQILNGLPGTGAQRASLEGIEFFDARLALHTDPIYAPADPAHWSFLNCQLVGGYCEASMWLSRVISGPPSTTTSKLWKSWVTHRQDQPRQILHEAQFKHLRPTPSTFLAQDALSALQGRDGLWFAGGYLQRYDSQETALRSAIQTALGLAGPSARTRALLALADDPAVQAELIVR
jgi:predicted NAD/FAD-binding protein